MYIYIHLSEATVVSLDTRGRQARYCLLTGLFSLEPKVIKVVGISQDNRYGGCFSLGILGNPEKLLIGKREFS